MSKFFLFSTGNGLGWGSVYHMENLFTKIFSAECQPVSAVDSKLLRAINICTPRWRKNESIGVLFCKSPVDLRAFNSIPNRFTKFGLLVAYIIDSMYIDWYGPESKRFDALFVTRLEDVEPIKKKTGRDVFYLPFGTDALGFAGNSFDSQSPREIDLLSFGRQPIEFDKAHIQPLMANHQLNYMNGFEVLDDPTKNQAKIFAMCNQAKYSLAFCSSISYHLNTKTDPMLTGRWYDALASGCSVAGKVPKLEGIDELIGWENSTVELPLESLAGIQILQARILNYHPRIALRNRYESLKRNDWRTRFKDMMQMLKLEIPESLKIELKLLDEELKRIKI